MYLKIKFLLYSLNKSILLSSIIIFIIIASGIFAPLISLYNPIDQHHNFIRIPPFWVREGNSLFIFGTDEIGRDIFSRIIYGARLSLFIGFSSTILSAIPGVIFGIISAIFNKWIEGIITQLMNIFISFPSLLLVISLIEIIGPGIISIIIAISISMLPNYVNLIRISIINELKKEYVIAAKMSGFNSIRLMFSQVMPNCLSPIIVQSTIGFSSAILDASALGFLGLGVQPPFAEWGSMLAAGREYIDTSWWISAIPGFFILITVFSINLLGNGLRDMFDPKLKQIL